MQQPSFLRFNELPEGYRRGIIAAGLGLLGIAAVAFAISYSALYAYASDSGLYSSRMARLYPLMLDLPVILGMGVSVLLAAIRGNRFWPFAIVAVCGALTVWFNVQHAGTDPGYRLMAAVPPVLVVMCIEAFLTLVHSIRKQLGLLAPLPYPGHAYPVMPGMLNSGPATMVQQTGPAQVSAGDSVPEIAQTAQAAAPEGWTSNPTKRTFVERYVNSLSQGERDQITVRELTADLKDEGVEVSERYVKRILDELGLKQRGKGKS